MTAKKQPTTALQAAQQCGINKGVQLQAFMKGVAYARKYGDWRSVKDELPEDDTEVLVVDSKGSIFKTELCDGDWFNPWYVEITHWMPLPEPPKTEEQC